MPGCVDIARSTAAPAGGGGNGPLIYIPYALDGVTASIGSTANSIVPAGGTTAVPTPATRLGALTAVGFDLAGLRTMYSTGAGAFPHGVTSGTCYVPYDYVTGLAGTAPPNCNNPVTVDLYVPPLGSGTRSFWLQQMYTPAPAPAAADWWTDHIVTAGQQPGTTVPAAFQNQPVAEHDGTAVSADPIGIAPFSIPQFIAQKRGHTNPHFFSAVLTPINAVAPTTGAGAGTLNTAFPIVREVYNVVQIGRVIPNITPIQHAAAPAAPAGADFDSNLAGLLVGANSQVCQDAAVIAGFGFGLLTTAPAGHHCGDIDLANLRGS
jgi:hypothetical protein